MKKIILSLMLILPLSAQADYLALPINIQAERETATEIEASVLTIIENRFRAEEELLNKLIEDKKESCKKTSLKQKLFGD